MAHSHKAGQEPVGTFSQLEVVPSERNDASPEYFNAQSYREPHAINKEPQDHFKPVLEPSSGRSKRRRQLIIGLFLAVAIVAIVLGVVLGTTLGRSEDHHASHESGPPTQSSSPSMSGSATSLSIYSYPTAVSTYPGGVDVFALDENSSIMWKYKNSSTSAWLPPSSNLLSLQGAAASFVQGVAATRRGASEIDIFVTALDYTLFYKRQYSESGAWSPWESLYGGLTTTPAVLSWGDGRLDVFVLGNSPVYELWQITYEPDGDQWSDWTPVGGSWQVMTPTAVSWGPGRLDVFVVNPNNKTLNHATGPAQNWTWDDLGGYCTSRPAAVTRGLDSIDVFVRGGDGTLWHLSYANDWNKWTPIDPAATIQAEPEAVSCDINSIELFAWRDDNALLHMTLDVTTNADTKLSSGGFSIVGQGITGPPNAVCEGVNTVHVFVYLQDGDIGHRALNLQTKVWSPSNGFELLGRV